MYIFSLILNLIGTVLLAVPLIRKWRDSDDRLVNQKLGQPKSEEENRFFATAGFIKDRKYGLFGLAFIGMGFLIQLVISLLPIIRNLVCAVIL